MHTDIVHWPQAQSLCHVCSIKTITQQDKPENHISAACRRLSDSSLQAFGAKNYHMVGFVWQRAIIILGLVCLPVSAILLSSKPILLLLGQTPAVADTTATYIRCAQAMQCTLVILATSGALSS